MKGTIIWLTLAIRFTPPISTAATQNASTSEAMTTDHEYSPRNGKTFTVCWFLGSKKLFTALDIPFTWLNVLCGTAPLFKWLRKEPEKMQQVFDHIRAELLRPGRDVRDSLPAPLLRSKVLELADLTEGMELTGTVRNVIDFGAFVDIAVHEDGLVHISQICNRYIRHPSEVLKVGDVVKVKVLSVDVKKRRIGLTMRGVKQN